MLVAQGLHIDAFGAAAVASACVSCEHLTLGPASIHSPDFFPKLASQCTALTRLALERLSFSDPGSLAALATGLPSLKELAVIDCDPDPFNQHPGLLGKITEMKFCVSVYSILPSLNTKVYLFTSLRRLSIPNEPLPLKTFRALLTASSCLEEVEVSTLSALPD